MSAEYKTVQLAMSAIWWHRTALRPWLRRIVVSATQRCSIALAIASFSASSLAYAYDANDAPVRNATCVADVSTWANDGFTFYRWLAKNTILFLRPGWHFYTYDRSNGAIGGLPGFDAAFTRSEHDPLLGGALSGLPNGYDGVEVARDGEHICWYRHLGLRAYTSDIRGAGYVATDLIENESLHGYCRWVNGRNEWIELPEDDKSHSFTSARIHRVNGNSDITLPAGMVPENSRVRDVRCANKRRHAQVTLAAEGDQIVSTAVLDIGDHGVSGPVHRYSAPIPGGRPGSVGREMAISPACDRVAWVASLERSSTEPPGLAVYVSSVDLKQTRLLTYANSPIYSIQWLPDQSAISFVYKSKLWSVPVDK